MTLAMQGQYEAAEKLYQQALAGAEKTEGLEHPNTLSIVNNLATALHRQGQYEAAEKLHQQALAGREKALGLEHPDTLTSINNLAMTLDMQVQHEAAEKLYQQNPEVGTLTAADDRTVKASILNMPASSLYDESPLDPTKREIRILFMSLDPTDPHVLFGIRRVLLDQIAYRYMAISYAWGDPNDTIPLVVDGHQLSVTRNLESALRHIHARLLKEFIEDGDPESDKKKLRVIALWADAVCINQASEEERSHQVSIMTSIYNKAEKVLVWLGDADEDSQIAISLMKEIGQSEGGEEEERFHAIGLGARRKIEDPDRERAWFALLAFLNRPWFRRIWVIQEVAAPKNANSIVAQCGNETIPFWTLSKGITCAWLELRKDSDTKVEKVGYYAHSHNLIAYVDSFMHLIAMASAYHHPEQAVKLGDSSLLFMLSTTRKFRATDPRDRVYALLGLISASEDYQALTPDYSKSTSQLYKEVFKHIVVSTGNFFILTAVKHPHSAALSLPSWVPDWSNSSKNYEDRNDNFWPTSLCKSKANRYVPSQDFPPSFHFSNNLNTFHALGFLADNIATGQQTILKSKSLTWGSNSSSASLLIRDWSYLAMQNHANDPYLNTEGRIDAFWRTLIADSVMDTELEHGPAPAECKRIFDKLQNPQLYSLPQEEERRLIGFVNGMAAACAQRRFYATTQGYMGIGPVEIQGGDRICILYGGCTPYILRDLENGYYQFVGETYVHGIMYGELMDQVKIGNIAEMEFAIM